MVREEELQKAQEGEAKAAREKAEQSKRIADIDEETAGEKEREARK